MNKSNQTKDRIKKVALTLFNRYGTSKINTHDIAEKAGISPGNLYYHYRNKEEIVRELFLEISIFDNQIWSGELSFSEFLDLFFGSIRKYSFFFVEFTHLLKNDEELRKNWRKTHEELSKAMIMTAERWVEKQILKPFKSRKEIECFIDTAWIILNFSSVYFGVKDGASSKKAMEKSLESVVQFLLPYHTKQAQKELQCILKRNL